MSRFWSPFVAELAPYVPGEQPRQSGLVKLNTNENPYGPSPRALEAIRAATDDGLRLYPDPAGTALAGAIAATHGLATENVFLGNGSDEVLAHAFNAFFRDKGPVLFPDVTYSFYPTYCRLYGVPFRRVEVGADLRLDPADFAGPAGGVVIANPNAPTGIAISLAEIETILARNPDVVVLVDEAYVDFGADSAASLVPRFENLLVVHTFSKSRSLAGLRVGFALGQPALIEGLQRVKDSFNSYPLGRLALAGALAAWEDRAWFDHTCGLVMAERERTAAALRAQGFTVTPSAANFLFASPPGKAAAAEVFAGLRARNVLVRHFPKGRTADWLRISIGTPEECARLVEATAEILA